jgi:hypothetical protein
VKPPRIVSGGQTGVDRGALDAALSSDAPAGGWCPAGRRAEDGRIPARYPLRETAAGGYAERTARNVADSDGTLVLTFGAPRGGTAFTVRCCEDAGRALLIIDAASVTPDRAADLAARFVREHGLRALNIAGPRESEAPGARDYAFAAVRTLLEICQADSRKASVSSDNDASGAEHVVPRQR